MPYTPVALAQTSPNEPSPRPTPAPYVPGGYVPVASGGTSSAPTTPSYNPVTTDSSVRDSNYTPVAGDISSGKMGAALLEAAKENPSLIAPNRGISEGDEGFSIGGLVNNALTGFGQMVQGITNVAGAVGHDVLASGADILSDVTPLGEFGIADDPSHVLEIGKNIVGWGDRPSILRLDYQNRYGPIANGELNEFADRLYEEPLSFILDATMVGSAVAKPAQVAAKLAKAAGRPSPRWAEVVIGPGAYEAMSTTAAGIHKLPLSANPVIRGAQHIKNRLMTEELTKAAARMPEGTQGRLLIEEQLKLADEAGITRSVRPQISKAIEERMTKQIAGEVKSAAQEQTGQALTELHAQYLIPEDAKADFPDAVGYIEGALPGNLPGRGAVDNLGIGNMPAGQKLAPTTLAGNRGLEILQRLSKALDPKGPFKRGVVSAPVPRGNVFQIRTGTLMDAPVLAQKAADALGGTVLGIDDLFAKNMPRKGVQAYIVTPEGETVRISIGTDKFFRAENQYNLVLDDVAKMEAQKRDAYGRGAMDEVAYLEAEIEAAQMWAPTLFEGPVREVRAMLGEDYPMALSRADEFRVWNQKWVARPGLDHKILSYQQIMWRAYGPQRLAAYMQQMDFIQLNLTNVFKKYGVGSDQAARVLIDALQRFDPETRAAILAKGFRGQTAEQLAKSFTDNVRSVVRTPMLGAEFPGFTVREMHAARIKSGLQVPHYFAHKWDKMSDMATTGGPRGLSPHPTPPAQYTKKWMGFLEEEGRIIDDPIEVATRTFQMVNLHEASVARIEQVLQTFGRQVANKEVEAVRYLRNGPEVYLNPGEAKAQLSIRARLATATMEEMRANPTLGPLQATRNAIENLMPEIQKEAIMAANGQVYALPRHIANVLSKELRRATGWKAKVFWENPTSVWRAAVLAFSPRWIINNTIGNIVFQSIEDPRAFWYSIRQLSRKQRTFLEYAIGRDRLSDIEAGFVHNLPGGRYYRGASDIAESAPGYTAAADRLARTPVVRGLRAWSNTVRSVNSYIEEAFRRGSYMSNASKQAVTGAVRTFERSGTLLDRIAREPMTRASHNDAVIAVNKTLGNYTNLTPAEQQIFRGVIAPFYPFYKHVVKFTLRMPFDHPVKAALLTEISKLDNDMEQYLPEWLTGSVKVGTLGDGQDLYLRVQNQNPLEALVTTTGAGALLHPALKVAIERTVGRSLFTGKDYYDPEIYEARDGSKWQFVRDEQGRVVRVEPVEGQTLPSILEHVGQQFPQYTLAQDVLAARNPGYGAQASATGKVLTQQGQPVFPKPAWTILTNFLGVPMYPFNTNDVLRDRMAAEREAYGAGARMIP